MVMMFSARVWLMLSMSAASVVDLPLPVSPVTTTMPRWMRGKSMTADGKPNVSSAGMRSDSRRKAALTWPCWRNRLMRTRTPPMVSARSSSPMRWMRSKPSPAKRRASCSQSSCDSGASPSTPAFSRHPARRNFTGRPHTRCTSEAPTWRAMSMMCSTFMRGPSLSVCCHRRAFGIRRPLPYSSAVMVLRASSTVVTPVSTSSRQLSSIVLNEPVRSMASFSSSRVAPPVMRLRSSRSITRISNTPVRPR